ncbi:hypothetical protein SODALDRAFT_319794 [Sodiomyces alkalinus F11]|uniref:Uncharacterized protein n=1 Tax=Sodiomyces alkalinus (strain CBS 110278 / VKM F-3762 / F11) TaxID=1314773 RepID=A0A3N2Q9H3_SODAK|nr:hypothetical protein SODALDRAFT_319794 [Sodiomyces alkalinus F11]ROT43308.1 hypothetical protein SODALDRAFT_319794 [Sodiomyces alkalinus F11]
MDQTKVESRPEAPPATSAKPVSSPSIDREPLESPFSPKTTEDNDNNPQPHQHSAEDDDELSPPPENIPSPALPGSPASSPPADEQASDEIIVNSNRNGPDRPSPFHVVSDPEDETMPDADADDDDDDNDNQDQDQDQDRDRRYPQTTAYPKRKRTSTFADLSENTIDAVTINDIMAAARSRPVRRQAAGYNNSGVVLGYWRDSPVADDEGKHAVIGFIDVRDRLRTRIQVATRAGETAKEPVPPGPGGLWVTFERIVFEPYLVGLNHHQIKEFVKRRAGARNEDPDAKLEADLAAVEDAKRRVLENPHSDAAPAPAVAYGPTLPDDAIISASAKRRKLAGGPATILGGAPMAPPPVPAQSSRSADPRRVLPSARSPSETSPLLADSVPIFDPLTGTRPTRIVVGYWKPSEAPDPRDRHAVLGILGHNDNFRVKVIRETRDGRYVDGNFPSGAGALWIQWSETELEPHIKHLSRVEVKEYVRVRQYQIDKGEKAEERPHNETHAVYVAQRRALHIIRTGALPTSSSQSQMEDGADDASLAEPASVGASVGAGARNEGRSSLGGQDHLRTSHRRQSVVPAGRNSLSDLDSRRSSRSPHAVRRDIDSQARREVGRLEQYERSRAQSNADREADREAAAADSSERTTAARSAGLANGFHARDEVQQLDDIWQKQEEQRSRANNENIKFYGGTKYERKSTGPFVGKLVSQGVLISIDGEDYVEYRVLTKPSFC